MNPNGLTLKIFAMAALIGMFGATKANAENLIFTCKFANDFSFFITVNENEPWARMGTAIGIGDKTKAYFDKVTGTWIFIEFIDDGKLPSTLTTILPAGAAWHSRHTLAVDGIVMASQFAGVCNSR